MSILSRKSIMVAITLVLLGLSEITGKFGNIEVTPTTFIFNKQGKQLQSTIGTLDFVKLDQ